MATLSSIAPLRGPSVAAIWAALASPVVVVFLSSNFVNAGNLAFNMLFSRWMGPALFGDLALVLTIKLALLGLLGAVQMAVSRHVATHGTRDDAHLVRLNQVSFVALWCLTPLIMLLAWAGGGEWLGMKQPAILLIVLLSLPFAAPLSILRGFVHGRMDVIGILASANLEMLVRLVGAVVFWKLGFGAEGVAVAIGLSIFAGWAAIAGRLPSVQASAQPTSPFIGLICIAALPFAVLQAAQVLLLDGDIFAAKMLLDEVEAGHTAALTLFQRIEFFACFGLAAVLLPKVAEAAAQERSALRAAAPVMTVFAGVTIGVIACVTIAPTALITAMVGPDYVPVADLLLLAAISASAFTFSYLLATYLSALGDYRGIWTMAAFVPLQLSAFFITGEASGGASLNDLMIVKAGCQGALAAGLLGFLVLRTRSAAKQNAAAKPSCGHQS